LLKQMKERSEQIYLTPNTDTTRLPLAGSEPEVLLDPEDQKAKITELTTALSALKAQVPHLPKEQQGPNSKWIDDWFAKANAIKTQKDYETAKAEIDGAR